MGPQDPPDHREVQSQTKLRGPSAALARGGGEVRPGQTEAQQEADRPPLAATAPPVSLLSGQLHHLRQGSVGILFANLTDQKRRY